MIQYIWLCILISFTKSVWADQQKSDVHVRNVSQWALVQCPPDSVVQIFAQKALFDWLSPYRSPEQYRSCATGFFIEYKGELLLITNWHVVDQTIGIWIQVPSLGKKIIKVSVVSVYPDKDLAILRLSDVERKIIENKIGKIPVLSLGDSDSLCRLDEVVAFGYPLGDESLKSTTGVISGTDSLYEIRHIQTSAPINPGSSGGPLINNKGEVVGITNAGRREAQNTGYAIPINELKRSLDCMLLTPVVRRSNLGIIYVKQNEELTRYLGNPVPGGCYAIEILEDSPFAVAGIQAGDMIYQINGHIVDVYGDITVPEMEDSKLTLYEYGAFFSAGQEIKVVFYRNSQRHEVSVVMKEIDSPLRYRYPWFEIPDYEVFAGMVVMELNIRHVDLLRDRAPGLMRYSIPNASNSRVLVVTDIFQNSLVSQVRAIDVGATLVSVNGRKVSTLSEYRDAVKEGASKQELVLSFEDQARGFDAQIPVVLPLSQAIQETWEHAKMFRFSLSDLMDYLVSHTA